MGRRQVAQTGYRRRESARRAAQQVGGYIEVSNLYSQAAFTLV